MKKIIALGMIVAVICAGIWYFVQKDPKPKYKTESVRSGDLESMVTATGTVNAVKTVLVGTQVSGTLKDLYVDYNSPVKKGQLLAQIDPATFQAQVDQASANLLNAEANVKKSIATLEDSRRIYDRNKQLISGNFIAESDLDTSRTNVDVNKAQVEVAKAQVLQNRAALNQAETNLRYTKILSPVNGTVISRSVDVGQTVAASFQTPTLFTIAEDLTKMQIDTNVDEADISRTRVGQEVRFTVDAYQDIDFQGKVSEIRNAATVVSNVVTYDVVVQVDNVDLKLKPGMTANVSIITARKESVLLVPNSALRFRPKDTGESKNGEIRNRTGKGGRGQGIWVLENGKPVRKEIKTGINDGSFTEIVSGLQEGMNVITSQDGQTAQANQSAGSPPPPRLFH